MRKARLRKARLRKARLRKARLRKARLRKARLRKRRLRRARPRRPRSWWVRKRCTPYCGAGCGRPTARRCRWRITGRRAPPSESFLP
ncbi:pentapeptide repeat-containing protein [Streptomyces sp. ISL-87]|uniref:pentapeptide repeat-containing protein n=1 Tax=unclassified Streptomyces TaxID=2593676 RepID=UPI0035ABFFA8